MNREAFKSELVALINKHCADNASNTPDFILAEYLIDCLDSFNRSVTRREGWYGRDGVNAFCANQKRR